MSNRSDRTQITVELPPDLKQDYQAMAKSLDLSMSALLRLAMRQAVQKGANVKLVGA